MRYWDHRLLADGSEIDLIDDPKWWIARAEEARLIAGLCEDDISRSIMLRLADYYIALACAAR